MNLSDCNFKYLKSIAKDVEKLVDYEEYVGGYTLVDNLAIKVISEQLDDLIERIEKGLD